MRRSDDFRRTVRRGVRAGQPTVVVHVLRDRPVGDGGRTAQHDREPAAPLVGFVVSKAVGSAVRRNRVRRRLRHLTRPRLPELSEQTLVVIRALPPAATAGARLSRDLDAAWRAALAKLDRR